MLSRKVKCYHCGSHNMSDTEFCHKCGRVIYTKREYPHYKFNDIHYLI